MEGNSLLEVIAEKSANVEQYVLANNIKQNLSELLRTMGKREKITRESAIMVKLDEKVTQVKVTEVIESEYCEAVKKPSATYWADKDYVYAQFISRLEKEYFLAWIQRKRGHSDVKDNILTPNDNGEHLTRKPVRIIINNVRRPIKADLVEKTFKLILGDNCLFEKFHEGKPDSLTGNRAIIFQTDSEGFKTLFGTCDGSIPYYNASSNAKTRLFLKINCKPWICRDCFSFGHHDCEGKLCANCGSKEHASKDCKSKTKFCKNCKRKGHKAKDSHCPVYQAEIAKELRKVSIPLEFFEDKEKRFHLIKHIQVS